MIGSAARPPERWLVARTTLARVGLPCESVTMPEIVTVPTRASSRSISDTSCDSPTEITCASDALGVPGKYVGA